MEEKNKGGRPPTGKYIIEDMVDIINKYTAESNLPIVKEVCFINNWNYDSMMRMQRESPELRQSIDRLLQKKEIILEQGVHTGTLNTQMSMFTLKQPAHGWTDKSRDTNINITLEEDGLTKAIKELIK